MNEPDLQRDTRRTASHWLTEQINDPVFASGLGRAVRDVVLEILGKLDKRLQALNQTLRDDRYVKPLRVAGPVTADTPAASTSATAAPGRPTRQLVRFYIKGSNAFNCLMAAQPLTASSATPSPSSSSSAAPTTPPPAPKFSDWDTQIVIDPWAPQPLQQWIYGEVEDIVLDVFREASRRIGEVVDTHFKPSPEPAATPATPTPATAPAATAPTTTVTLPLPDLNYHLREQLTMLCEVADGSSRHADKAKKRIDRFVKICQQPLAGAPEQTVRAFAGGTLPDAPADPLDEAPPSPPPAIGKIAADYDLRYDQPQTIRKVYDRDSVGLWTNTRSDVRDRNLPGADWMPGMLFGNSIKAFDLYRLGYTWHLQARAPQDQAGCPVKPLLMELIDVTIPRSDTIEAANVWRELEEGHFKIEPWAIEYSKDVLQITPPRRPRHGAGCHRTRHATCRVRRPRHGADGHRTRHVRHPRRLRDHRPE